MAKVFPLPSVQLKSWPICPAKKRERFTSRKCVIVIGFDGGQGDILQSIPAEFNRYVDDYNEKLRTAVNNSAFLKQNAEYFRTVPEITGGRTGFNEDGLHYSDDTIKEIVEFILEH